MVKILISFVSMFTLFSIQAQSLDVRIFGGFNVMQLTSDEGTTLIDGTLHDHEVSGRPGLEMGGNITFGKRFYIQPGFKYTTFSLESVNSSRANDLKFKDLTRINTFAIPLKVGFRMVNPEIEDLFNVRVFGGFDGQHVLSVNHTKKSGKVGDITVDDFNNLIIYGDVGMGVDFLMFYVDLGYQIGLTPVYTTGDNHATANTFYSNFGLRLKL